MCPHSPQAGVRLAELVQVRGHQEAPSSGLQISGIHHNYTALHDPQTNSKTSSTAENGMGQVNIAVFLIKYSILSDHHTHTAPYWLSATLAHIHGNSSIAYMQNKMHN